MKRVALILAALFCFIPLTAQEKDRYDIALDQYENICIRCLELRKALDIGEIVSSQEMSDLLGKLESLRQTLAEGNVEMSDEQRKRLELIKARYLAYGEPSPTIPDIITPSVLFSLDETPAYDSPISRQPSLNAFILAIGGLSKYPDIGLMCGTGYGKWGGYLSLRARAAHFKYDYKCDSTGNTDYGQIWTNGKVYHPKLQMTAGVYYGITWHWHAFAGLGYSSTCLLWEDIDGRLALVTDLSHKGLCAEAGVLFFYSHIAVGAGLSTTGPFVAAGYRF